MNLTEQFLQFALLGANWVLWLLVIISVASIAVMIERWLFYMALAGKDAQLVEPVNQALAQGDLPRVAELVRGVKSAGARMLLRMIEVAPRGQGAVAAIMEGSRASEKLRLERNLNFLGTVGANAPFVGLFGTVLEILRVFHIMGETGVGTGGEAEQIMSGIAEALVATAVGLLVAIPAVIAYNAGARRVKRLMAQSDSLTSMALSQILDERRRG